MLGKPIKDPADFYGRAHELRELFESVVNMQPVALVGEHRCGNTSLLYQLLNAEVRARHLGPEDESGLLFVFVNAQLAAEGPEAFYRRVARAAERADPEAQVAFDDPVDAFWIEDYLDDLADRDRRLVLLLDEFEVLSSFESGFWEWFRGLIIEYDLSIVVATRVELGEFREEWGIGSPFFNMFRAIYVGSFGSEEVDEFLSVTGERAGVDFSPMRPTIVDLAGRFPYFLQVAASLCFRVAQREPLDGLARSGGLGVARVRLSHRGSLRGHLGAPASGRARCPRLAGRGRPTGGPRGRELPAGPAGPGAPRLRGGWRDLLRRLRRLRATPDDAHRAELETGEVRIEKRAVDLPPKEFALLKFLLDNEGEVVTKDEIAAAVWPEYTQDAMGVTDAMIQKTISRLRKEVDVPDHASSTSRASAARATASRTSASTRSIIATSQTIPSPAERPPESPGDPGQRSVSVQAGSRLTFLLYSRRS